MGLGGVGFEIYVGITQSKGMDNEYKCKSIGILVLLVGYNIKD